MSGPLGFGGGGGAGTFAILNQLPLSNSTSVYTLRNGQALATVTYPNLASDDLEVMIGSDFLAPYIRRTHFPWIVEYDWFNGFRIISGSRIILYNAPSSGTNQSIRVVRSAGTQPTRRYPFTATTIAFGE